MSDTIDVTGLRPEAIRALKSLVMMLQEKSAKASTQVTSVFDFFGKAPRLRTGDEIARQIEDERRSWGES